MIGQCLFDWGQYRPSLPSHGYFKDDNDLRLVTRPEKFIAFPVVRVWFIV